jgi:tartrate-resistant acid phosphatase type 5
MKRWTASLFVLVAVLVPILASAGVRLASAPVVRPLSSAPSALATSPPSADPTVTFAVIGDFGYDGPHERAVATMVAAWRPLFVISTGDNCYAHATGTGTDTYDESVGAYYGRWLKDITTTGHRLPVGPAPINAFFPAIGNEDLANAGLAAYLRYFRLPGAGFTNSSGNERYYDYVEGPVHFFVLDSNTSDPSGTTSTSKQAKWLKAQLAASTSAWNVVYDHHPPYSSDSTHGSSKYMEWPFAAWGADVVLSGHAHVYERIDRNGIVYMVDGLGGAPRYAFKKTHVTGSVVRYDANNGALLAVATSSTLEFDFRSVDGKNVDQVRLVAP